MVCQTGFEPARSLRPSRKVWTVFPLVPKTSASTDFATDTKMRTGVEPVCGDLQGPRLTVQPPHQPQTPALAGVCLLRRLLLLEHPALWRALEDISAIMQIRRHVVLGILAS